MTKAGRKQGPLRGETPEANEFAEWLQTVTANWTLQRLTSVYAVSTTQWGNYRNGSRLPPSDLITKVADACVPAASERARCLAEGERRLKKARRAHRGQGVLLPATTVGELAVRLDKARQAQLEAERALFRMGQMVQALLRLVASLQDRCALLESQGETARDQLLDSRTRLQKAEELLEGARSGRREAEEIRLDAQAVAEQRQRDVASAQDPDDADVHADSADTAPALWEVDHILEISSTELEDQHGALADLRKQVPSNRRLSQILTPDIDHSQPGENADNPSISETDEGDSQLPSEPSPQVSLADSYRADTERVARILHPASVAELPLHRQAPFTWRGLLRTLAACLSAICVPIIGAAAVGRAHRRPHPSGISLALYDLSCVLGVVVLLAGPLLVVLLIEARGPQNEEGNDIPTAEGVSCILAFNVCWLSTLAALAPVRLWVLSEIGWAITDSTTSWWPGL